MTTRSDRLRALRDTDKLRPLLPSSLRDRTIEVDDAEPDPDRYLLAMLVSGSDWSDVAILSITLPLEPLTPESLAYDEDLYAGPNSTFTFERVPATHRPAFGETAYTRTNVDDPSRPGWALYSDEFTVGLIHPQGTVSDTERWTIANDIRTFLINGSQ